MVKWKEIYCISTKSFSPLMGPNAASRARAVKSLPEYPSVCLKDKTRQTMRQRSTNKGKECFNDGEGTESSWENSKLARCTLRWTGIEMYQAQCKATPTELEQTKKFQDLSTRVANIIHFAGHCYLARDSISDELSGLWFLTRSLDRRTFLV